MDEWKGLAATIVVVAGESLDREELTDTLGGGGRTVEWFAGADAMGRVVLGAVDLVVLDLAAEDADFMELIGAAHAGSPGLQILLLAGADDVATAVEAMEVGAAEYLTKPVDPAALSARVDRLLDRRRLQLASDIASIVHRLASTTEAAKLPPRVVDAAIQATRARHGWIFLIEDGQVNRLGGSASDERPDVDALVAEIIESGVPLQTLEEEQGPILGWPMVAHNAGVGVLVVAREPGNPHFTAGDEQQMSIVATEAALSLDRVRLIDRLRQQVDDLAQARLSQAAGQQLMGIGQLATGYAHELQGPLQYLQSHLRSASDALESGDSDEVRKGLRTALETAARIQSTVGELSLLGRGKDDAVVDAARLVALAKRIALSDAIVEVTESVPYCGVQGNVGHLVQALVLLLRNAVRASRGVDDPALTILVTPEGDQVRFSILDNGPGLPDEVAVSDLFSPFVSTWEGHNGLGLGMARQIATEAGGRVSLKSLPGGGAEATIWLPGVGDDSTLELGGDDDDLGEETIDETLDEVRDQLTEEEHDPALDETER